MVSRIPEKLIEDIMKGNCVAFVGAGVSIPSGLPSWPNLLTKMIDWYKERYGRIINERALRKHIRSGDLLDSAEELLRIFSKNEFHEFLEEVVDYAKDSTPNELHDIIYQIPFSAILTTNYDQLIELTYLRKNNNMPRIFSQENIPYLARSLRDQEFHICHAHGSVQNIKTVVFGRKHYAELIHNSPAFQHYLRTIFSVKTVFFIGYGVNDPDLNLLLEDLVNILQGYGGAHYALIDEKSFTKIKINRLKDCNIQPITYKRRDETHPEVKEYLKSVLEAVLDSQRTEENYFALLKKGRELRNATKFNEALEIYNKMKVGLLSRPQAKMLRLQKVTVQKNLLERELLAKNSKNSRVRGNYAAKFRKLKIEVEDILKSEGNNHAAVSVEALVENIEIALILYRFGQIEKSEIATQLAALEALSAVIVIPERKVELDRMQAVMKEVEGNIAEAVYCLESGKSVAEKYDLEYKICDCNYALGQLILRNIDKQKNPEEELFKKGTKALRESIIYYEKEYDQDHLYLMDVKKWLEELLVVGNSHGWKE